MGVELLETSAVVNSVRKLAKKATISCVMSVGPSSYPHGKTLLPLDGFS